MDYETLPEGYEWVKEWHELLDRSPFLSRSDEERLAEIEQEHAAQIEEIANSPVAKLIAADLQVTFAALSAKWGWPRAAASTKEE